jgi:hypothetical protein
MESNAFRRSLNDKDFCWLYQPCGPFLSEESLAQLTNLIVCFHSRFPDCYGFANEGMGASLHLAYPFSNHTMLIVFASRRN